VKGIEEECLKCTAEKKRRVERRREDKNEKEKTKDVKDRERR